MKFKIEEYTQDTFDFITSEFDDEDLEYFLLNITNKINDYLERYEEIQQENAYDNYVDMLIDEQRLRESESDK